MAVLNKTYAELVERASELEIQNAEMLKALQYMEAMMKYAHAKFNWGASALDAKAIQMLNDAPIIVHNVLHARGDEKGETNS